MQRISLAFLMLAACGGGKTQIQIGPAPAPQTVGTLVGPLCANDKCTCSQTGEDAGVPEGSRKRFEVRLKSAQQLWATLPGDIVLYKNKEQPEACYYVDLPSGQHQLQLRASDPNAVSAEIFVRELGTATKTWYDTFHFECGNPGACSYEELDAMKADYNNKTHNIFDKCGSTQVKHIMWDHGHAPDGQHPSELLVQATLDVYRFAPNKPHGDSSCGPGEGHDRGDDVAAPDEATP